jgi:hypothetical protein
MSDNIKYIDVDSEEWENTPKALRDQVKKLQSALTERSTALDEVRGQLASKVVGDVLSGQGFKNPKKVERDLLADKVDPHDEAAVKTWLEQNSDDYAKGDPTPAPEVEQTADPDAAQYERLNVGQEFKAPAGMGKLEAAIAEITPEMTGADVIKVYEKYGI